MTFIMTQDSLREWIIRRLFWFWGGWQLSVRAADGESASRLVGTLRKKDRRWETGDAVEPLPDWILHANSWMQGHCLL